MRNLIIIIDDMAISYCLYHNTRTKRNLMPIDTLKKAIRFAMMENFNLYIVYPVCLLPDEYLNVINSAHHYKIKSIRNFSNDAEILVVNFGEIDLDSISFIDNITYVLRIDKRNLFDNYNIIANLLTKVSRFNIIITDIESFTEKDFLEYEDVLLKIVDIIVPYFEHCRTLNVNILTDRIHLNQMNNCNAGYETITLAPNGNFYVCPAFYYANNVKDPKSQEDVCKSGYNIGNINDGLKIRNSHLYKLSHAPLCRICDAYHCKRCVWLNRLQTLEINTPSHEQCVVSHIERNVSKYLLTELKKKNIMMECKDIPSIDYLDPFCIRNKFLKYE